MAIVGIDLGTTNSLCCIYRDGKPEVIPNGLGEYLTPSCVGLDNDGEQILVGKIAKDRLISHPELTVASFKRYMGTDKKIKLGKKEFTAPELSSFVIRQLINDAETFLGEKVEEAVVSVPAYFDDNGRNATKLAGQLAGVKVERIINEPSAAALAYRRDDDEDATFLVVDFGGGTLDISIVDAFDNIIEITSVAGDNHLGGDDFNAAIASHFCHVNNIDTDKLSPDEKAILIRQAEMCKIALNETEPVLMAATINGQDYCTSITNRALVEFSATLFKRFEAPIRRALIDSDMRIDSIDYVVMVGGSSKMYSVKKYVEKLMRTEMRDDIDPDKVVAMGAGIVAGIKARNEDIKDTILTDICPFTLGVNTVNKANLQDDLFSPIIERNTVLPASRVSSYCTVAPYQKNVQFNIYQGENMYCRDNIKLGSLEVTVPRSPAGKEIVEVRFTYDINGILEVDAVCLSTGETYNKIILNKDTNLSDAELEEKIQMLQRFKILPKDQEANKAVLARAERIYKECYGEVREILRRNISIFNEFLAEQDDRKIRRVRKNFVMFLDQIEERGENLDVFMRNFDFDEYDEDDDE